MAKRQKTFKHRWRENGQHRQRSFPTRIARDQFALKLRLREETPASEVTFAEFAADWLERYCEQSETTKRESRVAIARHLVPELGDVTLGEMREKHLLDLKAALKKKTTRGGGALKPKTVNNLIGLAKKILQTAVRLGHIPKNPATGVEMVDVEDQAFDYWTAEERDRFVTFCRQRDPDFAELVVVAAHTGLRRGELMALERGQLDFERRQIRVDASYSTKLKQRFRRTKNKEVGFVPMNSVVYQALRSRALQPPTALVFDRHLFADAYDRLQRRCKEAGMRPIRLHDLRHTCASVLVMAGVPLYTVQKIMRHKTAEMTQRYAHLAPGHLADEVEKSVRETVRVSECESGKVLKLQVEG